MFRCVCHPPIFPADVLQASFANPTQIFADDVIEEKGENARLSAFVGAIAVGDLVKSTLGPKGMDKILQSAYVKRLMQGPYMRGIRWWAWWAKQTHTDGGMIIGRPVISS